MLILKELTISDKDLFNKYLNVYKPKISEFNFTNLFAWREYYRLKYDIIRNYLCLFSFTDESKPYMFLPIGNLENRQELKEVFDIVKEYFKSNGYEFILKKVYQEDLEKILDILGEEFEYYCNRNDSDYVYLQINLASLKGKKYHKKKNHVNKFISNYNYKYIPIDKTNKYICMDILKKWLKTKNDDTQKYRYEISAISEIVENFEFLDCIGAIIEVNGEPEAFTFGEKLNNDTAVIHIEKVNKEINGLGEFINWKFCRENFGDLTYVNREEDMGIEGLRKAKKSYLPEKLVEKYTVKLASNKEKLTFV